MLEMTSKILSQLRQDKEFSPSSISTRRDHASEEWENGFAIDGTITSVEDYLKKSFKGIKTAYRSEDKTVLINGVRGLYICLFDTSTVPDNSVWVSVRVLPKSWYELHEEGDIPYDRRRPYRHR